MIAKQKPPISQEIRQRIQKAGAEFQASDNISQFISHEDNEIDQLISEVTEKFEAVLDSLIIDRVNDPNSRDTGRRLAKMYINELMEGRYHPAPVVTAFPNIGDRSFQGMLVAHCDLKSMCSHHHQIVDIKCYIGLIPGEKVLGLSKYTRIAEHCARRGTLQEELTNDIADTIMSHTDVQDIAVQLVGRHGCMENRGTMCYNSGTYTAAIRGKFYNQVVRDEFFHAVKQIRDATNG